MKKPIAFVHAGTPKTGSTSIQHFLRDQEPLVTGQGLLVPSTGRKGGVHHQLNHALAGGTGNAAAELTAELRAAGTPNIIISAESIDNVVAGVMRQQEGGGAPPIELLRVLHECGYHVRFILYVRNLPQLLNSLYQQDTKAMRTHIAFDEWCEPRLARKARSLATWTRIAEFDDVDLLARPFNTAVKKEGVVRDFCRGIGIEPPAQEPPRANESIGPIYLQASRRIHLRQEEKLHDADDPFARALRRSLRQGYRQLGLAEPRYCGLTTERARAYEAAFAPAADAFAQTHWGHPWADFFAEDLRETFVLNDVQELADTAALDTARVLAREAIRQARRRAANARPPA